MELMSFREFVKHYLLKESIKVSKNNASKYFKQIQKVTKSKTFDIEPVKDGYIVSFNGGKESFSLLVDVKKGKDGYIVGYTFGGTDKFRLMPANFTSVEDILNDYKILKQTKGKELSSTEVMKKAEVQIELSSDDSSNDIVNDLWERLVIPKDVPNATISDVKENIFNAIIKTLEAKNLTTKYSKRIFFGIDSYDIDDNPSELVLKLDGKIISRWELIDERYGLYKSNDLGISIELGSFNTDAQFDFENEKYGVVKDKIIDS